MFGAWGLLGSILSAFTGGVTFSHYASLRCPFRWPSLFCLVVLCRVGEAANPGPEQHFVLGAFNPSGLPGKAPFIVSQLAQGDIWAISETHLSAQAMNTFRSSLHFAAAPYRYCVGGHPVPAQSNRMFHAAWRGVATLSCHPTRVLPVALPPGLFESARVQVTTTLVQDIWVTGSTIYGEPESGSYPHQRQNNELLLHHAASYVCHLAKGPRYVAGDWNVLQGTLPAFDLLDAAGFVDLQDLAMARWGLPVQQTCKQATRKDFCYVSRELQDLLLNVEIHQDIFPDHAVLCGTFRSLSAGIPRFVWPNPQPFPWPRDWNVSPDVWDNAKGSCEERYAAVWAHIELTASQAVPFGVSRKAKGRARIAETKAVVEGKVTPPKRARKHEVQPQFLCASFRHAQWLRQARRLQSYVRYVCTNDPGSHHACLVWGSIVRSTGFSPNFVEWWNNAAFSTAGAPAKLPWVPPSHGCAIAILETFLLAFRALEIDLCKASRQYARQRRECNPNAIFQDLKVFHANGVDVLLKPEAAQITEVRAEESAVILDRPVTFDPARPVFCGGHDVSVIHAEHDAVWVEDTSTFEVGQTMLQIRQQGTTPELFHLFLGAWKQMWARHQDVPPDRWRVILDFARLTLPRKFMPWNDFDEAMLARCIHGKKHSTSAGLDGVSRDDLKALPLVALQNFLSMFRHAECTGEWPSQVIAGRVTCLPKKPEPCDAMDFRPITVLGLLYRCWGTFQARQAIRALDSVLPQGLFGSRPHCYAGQVWSHLLWSIELAYEQQLPLCGIIADIQKAFNCLPRAVVFECCAILGFPFHILRAWAGALTSMPRRFQIRGSLSPPAFSSCGLPEGCALSCVGMMVIDMLFHGWMTHFFPLCQPLSYVDDWQILLFRPDQMRQTMECLESFTHALDLQLDHRKTNLWSTCMKGRQVIRAQGYTLVQGSRNLGAHVQFTRKHTNSSLTDRIAGVGSLWTKLRVSACGYKLKVRAVKCAAWPRALHGIAAATISHATLTSLRAGAMKGLNSDSAGANSMVQLGLIESPDVDPLCWSILQTIRLARDCGDPERVGTVLMQIAAGSDMFPANSITTTLLTRLQSVGWSICPGGSVQDMIGKFSLFDVSAAEIKFRVEFHWVFLVAAATAHRPCFAGLDRCDPFDTRSWLTGLGVSDQALFRLVLNGSHITNDGKKYCNESDHDLCPFCLCSDSRYHRFWECAHFEHARSHLTSSQRELILQAPEALTCAGWSLAPTTTIEWFQYFVGLEVSPVPALSFIGDLHLFTDGSCFGQNRPGSRFAGWAVVRAHIDTTVTDVSDSFLDAGVLPGLLQSAVRAEIYAVLRALQLSLHHPAGVHIWTDCDAVVRRLRRLLQGHAVKTNSLHADLWEDIRQCLQDRAGPTFVTRVSAHQDPDKAHSAFHEWCFRHNAAADRHANCANMARPDHFWHLFHRHSQALQFVNELNRNVQNVILTISREVVRHEKPVQLDVEPQEIGVPPPVGAWRPLPRLCLPAAAKRWYGDHLVRLVLSWFWQTLYTSSEPVRWISHYHLYADFTHCTGLPGPVHQGRWVDGASLPFVELRGFAFRQRARWFVKLLKECVRHLHFALHCSYGKPWSQMVLLHTGIIALPWPTRRLQLIDQWMLSCSGTTFRRQCRLIDALPLVDAHDEFPPVFMTTMD